MFTKADMFFKISYFKQNLEAMKAGNRFCSANISYVEYISQALSETYR